jgi:hypothetical protein
LPPIDEKARLKQMDEQLAGQYLPSAPSVGSSAPAASAPSLVGSAPSAPDLDDSLPEHASAPSAPAFELGEEETEDEDEETPVDVMEQDSRPFREGTI